MLKKLLILFIAIAPMVVVAQNFQIAYINSQEVLMAMPEIADMQAQVASREAQMETTLQELQTEYNRRITDFQSLPEGTSEAIMVDRLGEIHQMEERIQTFFQNSQQELQQLGFSLMEPVQRRVSEAIEAIANEAGYMFVFDVASQISPIVFVHDNAVNITQRVKTRLGVR
jgi:outer membrane protein